jgi:hypothetical protein
VRTLQTILHADSRLGKAPSVVLATALPGSRIIVISQTGSVDHQKFAVTVCILHFELSLHNFDIQSYTIMQSAITLTAFNQWPATIDEYHTFLVTI